MGEAGSCVGGSGRGGEKESRFRGGVDRCLVLLPGEEEKESGICVISREKKKRSTVCSVKEENVSSLVPEKTVASEKRTNGGFVHPGKTRVTHPGPEEEKNARGLGKEVNLFLDGKGAISTRKGRMP